MKAYLNAEAFRVLDLPISVVIGLLRTADPDQIAREQACWSLIIGNMHSGATYGPPTLPPLSASVSAQVNTQPDLRSPLAVLMAVYGRDDAPLFERAILSILNQDWNTSPIRIYLCVDGPIDSPIERILEKYRHRIYKLLRNESRKGLARSLNLLLASLEDEEFVFRMDSDDFSHPNRFSMQIATMLAKPEIDILGSAINEVDSDRHPLRIIRYPQSTQDVYRTIPKRSPLAHATVCFRRRAIQQFVNYPETQVAQDLALWYRCLEAGLLISNIDMPLYDVTVSDAFYRRRRSISRAFQELAINVRGILRVHGFTWRLIFPFFKAAFRMAPRSVVTWAYHSRIRQRP